MNKETVDLIDFSAKVAAGLLAAGAGYAVRDGVNKVLSGEAIRKEPFDPKAFKRLINITEDILLSCGRITDTKDKDETDHWLNTRFATEQIVGFPETKVELSKLQSYVPPEDRDEDYEPDKPSYWITITKGKKFIKINVPAYIDLDRISSGKELKRVLGTSINSSRTKTRVRPRDLEMPDVRQAISILESVRSHPKPLSLS